MQLCLKATKRIQHTHLNLEVAHAPFTGDFYSSYHLYFEAYNLHKLRHTKTMSAMEPKSRVPRYSQSTVCNLPRSYPSRLNGVLYRLNCTSPLCLLGNRRQAGMPRWTVHSSPTHDLSQNDIGFRWKAGHKSDRRAPHGLTPGPKTC